MEHSLLLDLARRIKSARESAQMSQTDLAIACGWPNGSRLGNYEQATREASLSDLSLIADATGVRYEWLVAGVPPMIGMLMVAEGRATYDATGNMLLPVSTEDAAHLDNIHALSPELRTHIKALGAALAKQNIDKSNQDVA